jgi:hypothetical protein
MRFDKRGQLTIIVIVAIVMVVGIGGFFVVNSAMKEEASKAFYENEAVSREVGSVREVVEGCVKDLTLESIYLIGDQGGYYLEAEKSSLINNLSVPYYYYEGELFLPSLEGIEMQGARFILDNLEECIVAGSSVSFDVEVSGLVDMSIVSSKISYDFLGEVVLTSSEGYSMKIELEDYSTSYDVSLYEMYEVASYLTEGHNEDSELYCASCLVEMLESRDLFLDYIDTNENELSVVITDKTTDFGDYYFVYLNKYTGEEVSPMYDSDYDLMPVMDPSA